MSDGSRVNILPDTKINPEVKKQWVDALRSGKYKQGRNRLKTSDGCFCVIGVLCEVYRQSHSDTSRWVNDTFYINVPGKKRPESNNIYTTYSVDKWAEWNSFHIRREPQLRSSRQFLSSMNDSGRYTFEELANYIEENM